MNKRFIVLLTIFTFFNFCCKERTNNIYENNNILIVISGPSGVGKTTIAQALVKEFNIQQSISCTTRQPRVREINGKDYYFLKKEKFLDMIKNNEFYEYSNHFENYYGLPKNNLEKLEKSDLIVLTNLDTVKKIKTQKNKILKIILIAEEKTLINRIKFRKEKMKESELKARMLEFKKMKEINKDDVYSINTEGRNIKDVYKEVKNLYIALKNK